MAYIVNKSDGTVLTSVAPGTIDNSYGGLILIGKLYSGYGEALNENLVRLLENSSRSTAPTNPLLGQLWFDSTNKILKVCTTGGNTPAFKNVSGCITSSSEPANPVNGDLWWNTDAKQLYVYDSLTSVFVLIGPSTTTSTGQTGAVVSTMNDTSNLPHYVIKEYSGDTVVAVISKDTFTPALTESIIGNFPAIYSGYTLTNNAVFKFHGTVTNSDQLENNYANAFIKANTTATTNAVISFKNIDGIGIGTNAPASDLKINVTSGGDASITNQTASGLLTLSVKKVTTPYELIKLDPTVASPSVTIGGPLIVNADSKFIGNLVPSTTGTYNLGNSTTAFDTLYINKIRAVSTGNISLQSNVMPSANNIIDLGNSTYRFKTLYANEINVLVGGGIPVGSNLESPTIANASITNAVITNSQIVTANSITVTGNITPSATNVYTIGNATRVFNTVFSTYLGTAGVPTTLAHINNISPGTSSNIALSGNVTPSANVTYFLGTPAARFVNIFSSNINTIGANITGNAIIGNINTGTITAGNISVTTFNGITTSGNIMPTANNTIGIGNSTYRFADLYVTSLDALSTTFGSTNLEGGSVSNSDIINANITISNISNTNIINSNIITSVISATGITMLGNIIPSANTYTIGNASRIFSNVFAGNIGITSVPVSTLYVNKIISGTGSNVSLGSNVTPDTNGLYNLGTAGARLVNVFTNNINSVGGNFSSGIIVGGDILTSGSNATVDIGSASRYFGNIYGTAMLARYADLAERYHADEEYDSGTVVKLGGPHEITQTVTSGDISVFGVISTDPGLILNAGAGNDETHPLIALTGRVPCKVIGSVNKGDRLVSSDIPGVARAYSINDDVLAIIGRSLVNKTSTEIELIEIVVGVK